MRWADEGSAPDTRVIVAQELVAGSLKMSNDTDLMSGIIETDENNDCT